MHRKTYIFLDIDGVLTNQIDEVGSYINHSPENYGLSKTNLTVLEDFCNDTNSKIIVSSNWRKFDLDGEKAFWYNPICGKIKNPLDELYRKLGKYIVGELPKIRHKTKSECLIQWFIDNGNDCNFAIFDDDTSEGYSSVKEFNIDSHIIYTNDYTGLTTKDCKKAKEILNK